MSRNKVISLFIITLAARVGGGVRWYLRELMGDSRYSRYVEHARSHEPGAVLLSEREFWHRTYREEAVNPRSRCC